MGGEGGEGAYSSSLQRGVINSENPSVDMDRRPPPARRAGESARHPDGGEILEHLIKASLLGGLRGATSEIDPWAILRSRSTG